MIVLHFDERAMGFFTSPDLKSWTFESEIELPNHLDMSDCPELFQLPINGDDTRKKWILYIKNLNILKNITMLNIIIFGQILF